MAADNYLERRSGSLTPGTWVESRHRADALGPLLADRHRAIGQLQISSIHAPHLARKGIALRDLWDPCVSFAVGAWVLRHCIDQFGETWKAVGCYNTGPGSSDARTQWRYAAGPSGLDASCGQYFASSNPSLNTNARTRAR